jgi:anti-sigma-K factor RskA
MTEHTEIVDLIPAYALHMLDEDEARRVAAHLETCQSCREELAAYEQTAAYLAASVPLVEPPGHLKGRLMARIQPEAADPAPTAPPLPWWERVKAGLRFAAPVWAPVSAALILALLVGNLVLWQQVRQSARQEVVAVALTGTDAAPEANGVLVLTPKRPDGVLLVSNLTPLPDEQQYQLWLIAEDGSRDSGAVFSVAADGRAEVDVSGRKALPDYAGFGITVEPAGGSPGPTGQQVLGSGL